MTGPSRKATEKAGAGPRLTVPLALAHQLSSRLPMLWLNPNWQRIAAARAQGSVGLQGVEEAARRCERFASLVEALFPSLSNCGGRIESPLLAVDALREVTVQGHCRAGRWLLKSDHALPIAGSIKARGGFYEVLLHAETLAASAGLLKPNEDIRKLVTPNARAFFAQHEVTVGSTGNLGLSIGIMAAALGFRATVHMSQEARAWKKARLRSRGVEVIEHPGDFGEAVDAGRQQAAGNARVHFVDDENSRALFFGYSVAALELRRQLVERAIAVDSQHPLFVYIPCGVGGAPGGITFGLKSLIGDHVHCFFAEPVEYPGVLLRLASDVDQPVSVRELGLGRHTEADGLAVARASNLVAPLLRSLVSGVFTVPDDHLFEDLYRLELTEQLKIEPSAAAALRGPRWLTESDVGREYLERHSLTAHLAESTHVLWTTGGSLVPEDEYRTFHARGKTLLTRPKQ